MKFLKTIFSLFSETGQLPVLIREAEVFYRAGNFPAAIGKADEALALINAFAPRTAYILYLRAACLVNSGKNAEAIETWKSILNREPAELPPAEFYPALKQVLHEIAGLIYIALGDKKQPGSYYLRLSANDTSNYTVRSNSLFVKEEIKYISSVIADILFIVGKHSSLNLTVYYENSADGGVDSELIFQSFYYPEKNL